MLLVIVAFGITLIAMVIEFNHQHIIIVNRLGRPHFAEMEHAVSVKADEELALIMEE